jgi:hypothetical protein
MSKLISKLTKAEKQELWVKEQLTGDPRSLIRIRANQILQVCYPEGVDTLTDLSKTIFDIIPPTALTLRSEELDRDLFYTSVELLLVIVQLAVVNGRPDLGPMGIAVHAGLVALDERKKGISMNRSFVHTSDRRGRRAAPSTFANYRHGRARPVLCFGNMECRTPRAK